MRIGTVCVWCVSLLCCVCGLRPWGAPPMRWPDAHAAADHVAAVTLQRAHDDGRPNKNIATGVFIDTYRVLTSYNPFRELINSRELLDLVYVCTLHDRNTTQQRMFYNYDCAKIVCGRPLLVNEAELRPEQWWGSGRRHSPAHDLLVLRVRRAGAGAGWRPDVLLGAPRDWISWPALPLLPSSYTPMPQYNVKFLSLGLLSESSARKYLDLELAEYTYESVRVDCVEWLPKNWGYFICLKNDREYKGFASSALLYAAETLFGVGSFTMWRQAESIFVFTDIRPYLELINNTCTEEDMTK